MQEQKNGTFIWQENDIITTERMNRLLLEDNVIILEADQDFSIVSYDELEELNKNKIIFYKEIVQHQQSREIKFYILKQLSEETVGYHYTALFECFDTNIITFVGLSRTEKLTTK